MAPPDSPTPAQTLRRSTAALLAFWLLLAGALWWGFAWWEGRQRAGLEPYQMAGGELVIPRSRDGHFYVRGEINRQPVGLPLLMSLPGRVGKPVREFDDQLELLQIGILFPADLPALAAAAGL